MTPLEKPTAQLFVNLLPEYPPGCEICRIWLDMNEKPALEPCMAVGEALRAAAHTILTVGRAAIEELARSEADTIRDAARRNDGGRCWPKGPFLGHEANDALFYV